MKTILFYFFLLSFSTISFSQNYSVNATLSGANEVPPNGSTGTGTLSGSYDSNTNMINLDISYSGLSGNLTAAHLHKAPAGSNGAVIINLNPPTGSTSGSITGTFAVDVNDESDLINGDVYVNLHSSVFPVGELRGQLSLSIEAPDAQVTADDGDIYVTDNLHGVILKAPNGNCYRVQVDNTGTLVTVQVACP